MCQNTVLTVYLFICVHQLVLPGVHLKRDLEAVKKAAIFLYSPVFSRLFVCLVVVCSFLSSFECYEIVKCSFIYLFVHHLIDLFDCLFRSTKDIVRHLLFSFVD